MSTQNGELLPALASYVPQVGGNHYGTKYGHWDFCDEAGIAYLEACASKYVYRWRLKAGVEDLKKAISYIDKRLASIVNRDVQNAAPCGMNESMFKFFDQNAVPKMERTICALLFYWGHPLDLVEAKEHILDLINDAEAGATARYVNQD